VFCIGVLAILRGQHLAAKAVIAAIEAGRPGADPAAATGGRP
jgi:hypothetical protein